ncbi:GNAT family N-acetyltransferase [Paeniglutamicibacter psychrophenolicus]|uniref:Ribosomal protein S18 acetylase RimI-like enzyme n=1 Tax=Paeniglutamicibacter psychrophenolicus TaxID=257454 RepID=A0ABS4WEP7_9MICC|nr:GNAT family N-acetyltransferase [Paeniglutamicibacter psychrophenolicus]MBP2374667.1 ribosomal protein S18 acetylase RimI-like enzyme [Paeniglutamicibacter psychrophenolicus]
MDASEWNIGPVVDAAELVAASGLFDSPVTERGARAFLGMPGHHLLLARSGDGAAVGFVSGVVMRHPDKDAEMFVYELGVDEHFRQRGIAAALLRALAALGLELGCTGMWTGTERANAAALATYRSLGAVVDAESVFIEWDSLDTSFAPFKTPNSP